MEVVVVMLVSFALFAGGCWYLIRLITRPEWVLPNSQYSKTALRLSHSYKIAAVGVCLVIWFWTLFSAFWSILSQRPF